MTDQTPSGREMEILKVLWEIGPATVREVHQRLCPQGELAFNTVQTLLRIMDDKGLVTHREQGRAFVYSAKYSREREAARFLAHVFDGALDQCVLSMLQSQKVSSRELAELARIIAEARRRKAGTGREGRKRRDSN